MKNTGKCPKCGSEDIIRRVSGSFGFKGTAIIRVGFTSWVYLTHYICGQCGFVEDWVDSRKDIERLR